MTVGKLENRRPGVSAACVKKQKALLPIIRKNARKLGYAVAIHGSQLRDIDLVAIPWTDAAVSQYHFFRCIFRVIKAANPQDRVFMSPRRSHHASKRPHGRLAWAIHVGFYTFIDLSVMPRYFEKFK